MNSIEETQKPGSEFLRKSIDSEKSLISILRLGTHKREKIGGTTGFGHKMLNIRNRKVFRRERSEACESDPRSHDEGEIPDLNGGCCDKKICWYQPPLDCLSLDFCNNTSLHGLKYLGQSKRHLTERIFWLVAFLVGCFAAVFLISDVWKRYNQSPVIVSFEPEETNIDHIPFPAITICNMNKVLRSKAIQIYNWVDPSGASSSNKDSNVTTGAERDLYYLDHVCSSSKSFTNRFNFSSRRNLDISNIQRIADRIEKEPEGSKGKRADVRNFLKDASQRCVDMISLCTWKDRVRNCSELFRPVETDFGKCCTFNMVPQTLLHIHTNDERDDKVELNLWNKTNLEEQWLAGDAGNISSENLRPRRQNQAGKSFGLSILLDPDLDEYFCTTSDSVGFRLATHLPTETPHVIDYGIAVMPNSEVFISVRPELTKADATIHGYPLYSRNCYFPYEFNLTYYQYYTASNCIDECVAESVFKKCGCVRYYMPRDDNRSLCGPSKFSCTEDVKGMLAEVGLKRNCSQCLPSCTEITYFEETTTTPLQSDNNWSQNKSFSIVHIYFGQDSTYARIRKELYGTTDLFANTGGLMGLCLGFSGLSAMEVIYFLTLRAWCRKRRKRTIGAKVAAKFRDIWIKVKGVQKYGSRSGEQESSFTGERKLPSLVQSDFHVNKHRAFNRLPSDNVSSKQTPIQVLMNTTSSLEEPQDGILPSYNSIIEEISPFYAQRYWNTLCNGTANGNAKAKEIIN